MSHHKQTANQPPDNHSRLQAKGLKRLKPANPKERFALEGLEARVMLSADPLFNTALAVPPDEPENLLSAAQEVCPLEATLVIKSGLPETCATPESTLSDPKAGADDLFAGLTGEELTGVEPEQSR
jgi:hypothetical protein